ncbi:MAG: trigger factor [Candidatus Omnitrophica bacterium]|nr:trigger factor [Candidatus Omnitrophota bacterium]
MSISKAKSQEACSTLFEIDVPKESVDKAFEEVYDEITKVANIPGFRVGKAPKELVKKHYAKNASEEAIKRVLPDAYAAALKEHGIIPIGSPEITDMIFEEGKAMSFKARVETRPKFSVKNYKGIAVTRKKIMIDKADIDKTLENARQMRARYESPGDRPLQMGDYAVSDLDCLADGKPIHRKREDLWLFLDKDTIALGLSDGMVGMKKGDEKDIEVTLSKDYPNKDLAGKKAVYHVKVKDIKVRQLPEIDDALAKELGKDSLESLKKDIEIGLEEQAKRNSDIEVENKVLAKLIDDNDFAVPGGFVKRQLGYMVENAKRHLAEKGFRKEDLDKKDEELRGKFGIDAVRRVRLLFILDAIARAESIDVGEKDVEEAYKAIAAETGKAEIEVKEHYGREELVDDLKEQLREGKAIEFLIKSAKVTEE